MYLIYATDLKDLWVNRKSTVNPDGLVEMIRKLDYEYDLKEYLSDYGYESGSSEGIMNYVNDYSGTGSGSGYFGVTALLADLIGEAEEIDIDADDAEGRMLIGLSYEMPWTYTEKTKSLSQQDFIKIMKKYLAKIFITGCFDFRQYAITDCD